MTISTQYNIPNAHQERGLLHLRVPQLDTISLQPSHLNELYEGLTPTNRIAYSYELFGKDLLVTTSGGRQARVLPTLIAELRDDPKNKHIAEAIRDNPIVLIDTGDLFEETIDYVKEIAQDLDLKVDILKHHLTAEEFEKNRVLLIESGASEQDAFDELTKVRPMQAYIQREVKRAWISGNRRDQSPDRANLPYITEQNGFVKIFPLVDLTVDHIAGIMTVKDMPPHPLADLYASIGNRSETGQSVSGMSYEKYMRHKGEKLECGLHTRWVHNGKIMRRSSNGHWQISEDFPIVVEPLSTEKDLTSEGFV